jgi:glucose-6-phosphate dehydrogenase assembly protein OpcA
LRLKVDATRKISTGPGLTAVRMATAAGDIAITRPDGLLAYYAVPGQPERLVALKRRDYTELISEELRRMDADDVYEQAVKSLLDGAKGTGSTRSTAKKASSKKTASKKTAAKKVSGSKKAESRRSVAKQAAGNR